MTGVPASSRGLSTGGGTLTGALRVQPSASATAQGVRVDIPSGLNWDTTDAAPGFEITLPADTPNDYEVFEITAAGVGPFASNMFEITTAGDLFLSDRTGASFGVQLGQAGSSFTGGITTQALVIAAGAHLSPLTSGALPTVAPVTTTPFQCSTTRDVTLIQVVTYNPTAGAAATCKVELSPDNVTYSTLITISYPPGVVFDGTVLPVTLTVPAAWRVKLTTTNATLGTGTYY